MNIIYHGPREKPDMPYPYYEDLKSMAQDSDVDRDCVPGGDETRGLIDYAVLEALGKNGFLVNIARGSVVNEQDLLMALRNKAIAGVGLDVFLHEPTVPAPLLTMDNVVLTPHIGSATIETRTKMGQIVAGNLLAHFDGKPLLTPVNL